MGFIVRHTHRCHYDELLYWDDDVATDKEGRTGIVMNIIKSDQTELNSGDLRAGIIQEGRWVRFSIQ
jgi:hypothetical protein